VTPEREADEPVSVQHLLALKSFPLLRDVEPDELAALAARTKTRRFAAGEDLSAAGAPCAQFVLEGELDDVRGGLRGRRHGAQTLAGAVAALAGVKTSLIARTAGESLEIERDAFLDVLTEQFGVLHAIMADVAARSLEDAPALAALPSGVWPHAIGTSELADRIGSLARSSLLRRIPVRVLGYIARESVSDQLGDGAALWRAGDLPGRIAFVERGCLRVVPARGRDGVAGPGAILGLEESLAARPRWCDVVARGDTSVVSLDVAVLLDILEDEPQAVLATLTRAARFLVRPRGR
jgi:CRP-like cAMP-binding protein